MTARIALCLVILLAGGCLAPPRQAPQPPARAAGSVTTRPPGEAAPTSTATTLLQQARSERAAGELTGAESTIERALRIEPNDPWLWIELGEIKRAAGDETQAAAMGRKALSLAATDRAAEARARTLLR